MTIRDKLLLAIGAPLLAAYGAMLAGEFALGRRSALADAKLYLTELVAHRAAEFERHAAATDEVVSTLAIEAAAWPDFDLARVRATLERQLAANDYVFGMCAAFEPDSGSERPALYLCRDASDGLRQVDPADVQPEFRESDWYRPARTRREGFWTEPYFDAGIGERMMCTFTAPIVSGGRFRGVLTADLLTDDLIDRLRDLAIGEGYCLLISPSGRIISHPDRSLVLHETIFSLAEKRHSPDLARAGRQMIAGNAGAQTVREGGAGPVQWMVYAPIRSTGWSLAAVVAEKEVAASIHPRLARLTILPGAALAIMLLTVWIASVRITRPIARLDVAAESLAKGDLEARVPETSGGDEIARLGRRFNAMAVELKDHIDNRLREEAARKRLEGELAAAREIQTSLLPPLPPADQQQGYCLHAVNLPAKSVAGDFFDYFMIDATRMALVMADVSGKGLPAALYMAVARTTLRACVAADRGPRAAMDELNRRLCAEDSRGMFVTLFLAYYQTDSGELTYCNAGHNPPMLVRQAALCEDVAIESLDPTGPLAAVFPEARYREERRTLAVGDLLFLYTDGITEAGAGRGELYGEQRLENLLRHLAARPVDQVCCSVLEDVRAFADDRLDDDVTMLALRRCAAPLRPT